MSAKKIYFWTFILIDNKKPMEHGSDVNFSTVFLSLNISFS